MCVITAYQCNPKGSYPSLSPMISMVWKDIILLRIALYICDLVFMGRTIKVQMCSAVYLKGIRTILLRT